MALFLAAAVLAYAGMCYALARRYVQPHRDPARLKPAEARNVELPWSGGSVPAWSSPGLADGRATAPAVFLLVHGYGGNRDSWAEAMRDLMEAGAEVVVPAMPGHDASPDPSVGFGPKEAEVLLACARWARSRHAADPVIVAVGVSMGGAACWLAAERDPKMIQGVVSEGAFAVLDEAVDRWFGMLLPGGRYGLYPVRSFANRIAHVNPSSVRPVDSARAWAGRPALVIHCEQDALIVASHATRLSNAAGCELWTIPGAGHAEGYVAAREQYLTRMLAMAEEAMRRPR